MQLIDILASWPGLAALAITLLATLVKPATTVGKRAWKITIAVVGATAIVASIASQVMTAQEQRESSTRENMRDQQVGEVKGQMSALLQLIPGLATGQPELAIAAKKKLDEVQAQIASFDAKEHLQIAERDLQLSGPSIMTPALIPGNCVVHGVFVTVKQPVSGADDFAVGMPGDLGA